MPPPITLPMQARWLPAFGGWLPASQTRGLYYDPRGALPFQLAPGRPGTGPWAPNPPLYAPFGSVLLNALWSLPRAFQQQRAAQIEAGQWASLTSGTTVLELPAIPPRGLTAKQLKKWQKAHALDLRATIEVPTYGVQRPIIRGARDDPQGWIIPRKHRWPGSLIA